MTRLATEAENVDMIEISYLHDHGSDCCHWSRHRILSRLRAAGSLASALAALPHIIPWGPTLWPTSWCGLRPEKSGDCGVHAAIAGMLLDASGLEYRRGRALIRAHPELMRTWREEWRASGTPSPWIRSEHVHHEVLFLLGRWWDPSEARWFRGPGDRISTGTVEGVRAEGGDWRFHTAGSARCTP